MWVSPVSIPTTARQLDSSVHGQGRRFSDDRRELGGTEREDAVPFGHLGNLVAVGAEAGGELRPTVRRPGLVSAVGLLYEEDRPGQLGPGVGP